jgi:AcrR family transcriptional regulator
VQAVGKPRPAMSDSGSSGASGAARERSAVADRTDPRIARTGRACAQAIVALASQRPVSQITVADLANRAGVTRATFYHHYSSPLELLIQVLYADLERGHRREAARRDEGRYSPEQMLRLATADVADHVERFMAVYRHALHDPADDGVYEALVRHFHRLQPGVHGPVHPPGPA